MTNALRDLVGGFDWFVLVYFVLLNSGYLALIAIASVDVARWMRRLGFAGHDDIFANPLTPGVSVLVPAFNEELSIVESTHAMLAVKYPEFEVIVVDDGSTDGTFERMREAFSLVEVERVIPNDVPAIGRVLSTHAPASGAPLLVVRKENAGRRSDPLNVAINAARQPLICMVDADSLLEEESLLRVVKPFIDDPRIVATGGAIRAANGSTVERGRVVEPRMPRRWIERVQVLEYLRSFLLGRTGWSRLGALLIISGAFGVFRRDVVVEVGGLDLQTLGEDAELVTSIHRLSRDDKRDWRVGFVAEPVCWTEVPGEPGVLGRQRRRWSQGLAEILWKHRRMMLNPRYGRIGMVTLPYYFLFELIGPIVELTGIPIVILGFAIGVVNPAFALMFAAVALGYGMFVSVCALAVEEFSFRRYPRWRDLAAALFAAVAENVGYRQMHAWWRLQGLWRFVRRQDTGWGVMTRTGFTLVPAADETA
jgi:cellulose synthase/poly-beta-1,6-N-acetylglucosamine synthase-like glycosyltransferase